MNSESIFTEAIVCDGWQKQILKLNKEGLIEIKTKVRLQKAAPIYLKCPDGCASGIP